MKFDLPEEYFEMLRKGKVTAALNRQRAPLIQCKGRKCRFKIRKNRTGLCRKCYNRFGNIMHCKKCGAQCARRWSGYCDKHFFVICRRCARKRTVIARAVIKNDWRIVRTKCVCRFIKKISPKLKKERLAKWEKQEKMNMINS